MKKGLGTGLDALFGNIEDLDISDVENVLTYKPDGTLNDGVRTIPLDKIETHPGQPRKTFDELPIRELAESLKIHGLIQPILVTPIPGTDRFIIVAGERRYRAATLAEWESIPALVKTLNDRQRKEIALIENLQREDLNPIEEANAIQSLIAEYGLSQEEAALALGKSRPALTNILRLLQLEPEVQNWLLANRLSAAHGRALASIKKRDVQISYAQAALDKKMSVRQLELLVNAYINPAKKPEGAKLQPYAVPELKSLVNDMQRIFATKVKAMGDAEKGRIFIDYYTKDDLNRIFDIIESLKA